MNCKFEAILPIQKTVYFFPPSEKEAGPRERPCRDDQSHPATVVSCCYFLRFERFLPAADIAIAPAWSFFFPARVSLLIFSETPDLVLAFLPLTKGIFILCMKVLFVYAKNIYFPFCPRLVRSSDRLSG